jgi:hypothetical protein
LSAEFCKNRGGAKNRRGFFMPARRKTTTSSRFSRIRFRPENGISLICFMAG